MTSCMCHNVCYGIPHSLLQVVGEVKRQEEVHSVSTSHIHSVLEEVAAGVFSTSAGDVLLPADAYMCTPCVRSLEKLTVLRHDIHRQ